MTKTQIFDDVVSIVKNDASFIKDEVGADAEIYRKQISDDMDDDAFLYMLESYLGTFHVLGHLSFRNMKRGRLPFRVKPYGDVLYVIETAENSPLNVGDKIIKVDGTPIKEYGEQHINYFCGEAEERRGSKWSSLLSYAKELTAVSADDSEKQISVTLDGQWAKEEKYFCKKLSDNIALMRLADFADDIAITKMYRDNDTLLRESEYLIIDVRCNGGGNDSAFYPLWEFCLPEGKSTASLSESEFDSQNEYNYTERNCDFRGIHETGIAY